ncbi:MAG: SPFH domain-containing protein, partial [Lactobacillus crispatus]|nr:SPFH domain-containing protein [Lactobacillus crispatus]
NLIVVGKDEMTDLGKVPALKKVWDESGSQDDAE